MNQGLTDSGYVRKNLRISTGFSTGVENSPGRPASARRLANLPQRDRLRQRHAAVDPELTPFSDVRYDPCFSRVVSSPGRESEASMKRTFQPNRRRRRRTHGFLVRMQHQERPNRAQASPREGPQAPDGLVPSSAAPRRPMSQKRSGSRVRLRRARASSTAVQKRGRRVSARGS